MIGSRNSGLPGVIAAYYTRMMARKTTPKGGGPPKPAGKLRAPKPSSRPIGPKTAPGRSRRQVPTGPNWTPAEIAEAFRRFQAANPHPKGELEHINPFTLLVAVVLSAQATD